MSKVLAVDPGPTESAYALFEDDKFLSAGKRPNKDILTTIYQRSPTYDRIVIEMVACYGMPVGREVFETCVWIGRFMQCAESEYGATERIFRKDIKLHLCGSLRAKDANVRQAIIDLYGGKAKAIGTKKNPGPLYGVKGDEWAAIGVGLTYMAKQKGASND